MIRLFEATETEFLSNGLGTLSDATECKVTEERNGQFEVSLQYPIRGKHYSDLQYDRIIYVKPNPYSDPQAFQIYKIQNGLHGTCHIWAEHISYRLSKITCKPFTADTCSLALSKLKTNAVGDCPFTFTAGDDKGSVQATYRQKKPSSIRSRLGGEEGSILDIYRGEYEFDNFKVILHTNRGVNTGVRIRYGKNLTDFDQEKNIQDTYTAVHPYYYGSYEDEEDVLVTLPEDVIEFEDIQDLHYTNPFGFDKIMSLDLSDKFENAVPTETQLRNAAVSYVKENKPYEPKVSIKFNFTALRQSKEYELVAPLEIVQLCDYVTVEYDELGVSATAEVVKTVYNALTDRYESIEIGDAKTTLADTISNQNGTISHNEEKATDAVSSYQAEMYRMYKVFSGAYGGHVIFSHNANGELPSSSDPLDNINQIFVMDTDDPNTATKILWISEAGIAMSSDGFGNFNSVWSLDDGSFDARAITVINLLADTIVGGVIQDKTGTNYWDLDTGQFVLGSLTSKNESDQDAITNLQDTLDLYSDSISIDGSTIAIGGSTIISQGTVSTDKVAVSGTLAIGNHIWLSRSTGTNTTLVYAGG